MPRPQQPDSVSTEAQRQALDAMSQELVRKLDAMVAEQEQRVREFIRTQHSRSALPATHLPTPTPTQKVQVAQASIPAPRRSTQPPPLVTTIPEPIFEAPRQEPQGPFPQPRQQKEQQQEEGSIGIGSILTIVIAIVLLMRACS